MSHIGSFISGMVKAAAPALGIVAAPFGGELLSGIGSVAGDAIGSLTGSIAETAAGGLASTALESSIDAGVLGGIGAEVGGLAATSTELAIDAGALGGVATSAEGAVGSAATSAVGSEVGPAIAGETPIGYQPVAGMTPAPTPEIWDTLQQIFNNTRLGSGDQQQQQQSPSARLLARALAVGSDIYAAQQAQTVARQQQNAIKGSASAMDPFAKYRAGYGQQLQDLQAHPEKVVDIPGYRAGLTSIQRSLAQQGLTGSGNALVSLQQYGGNFYNQELARLAELAGAGAAPGQGASRRLDATLANTAQRNTATKTTASALGDLAKLFA